LNTISFGGLALGVGMLVDNSIVVLENIYRHREEGQSRREGASRGSKEVGTAIIASTLTTVAVFVPVVFISGMSGEQFKQLAYVVSFALICSLIVALTVVPMLCSRYLPRPVKPHERKGFFGMLDRGAYRLIEGLTAVYVRALGWAVTHRAQVIAGAIGLFALAVYLIPLIGVELQPEVDEGEVRVRVEMEPGTRVEVTDSVLQRMAAIARRLVPETRHVQIESGSTSPFRPGGQHVGELRLSLAPQSERKRSSAEIANVLRRQLQAEPGMSIFVRAGGGMFSRISRMGASEGDRLVVQVRGHDLAVLSNLADRVRERMAAIDGVTDAQISRRPGLPEMLLLVDRAKASSMGLNVSDVADTMETAIGGRRASYYREEGDEYQILVRLQERDRIDLSQVGHIPIRTPTGRTIPAESIVQMRRQEGPISISRADQQRVIEVAGAIANRDLGSIVADLDRSLRELDVPAGYELSYGGEWEEQQKAFRELTFAAILALILVYMVMASQFESLRDPFIILFSIPLAAIGVTAFLLATHTTFNIQGFLGVIILVGIVVNNAIVLIDYINVLRREYGVKLHDAVMQAGRNRLRPILMTTITTVLGLLPMSLGIGEGGEIQAPLARVVIGGLVTSTLITLVLIPVVYLLLEERTERAKALTPAMQPAPGD
jgi:HAE1 family hydrophobic/amphiphilic exporter-1